MLLSFSIRRTPLFLYGIITLPSCISGGSTPEAISKVGSPIAPAVAPAEVQEPHPFPAVSTGLLSIDDVSVTRLFFRNAVPDLDEAAFNERWNNSLASPLLFLRSHVRAYYKLLAKSDRPAWPIGICLGDPHPENFGFTVFGKSHVDYVANDFDDSDLCPVILDALRYFTALSLVEPEKTVQALLDEYFRVLHGDVTAKKLDPALYPSLKKKRKRDVRKSLDDGRFSETPSLKAVDSKTASQIREKVGAILVSRKLPRTITDVMQVDGLGGGSRGLIRYWIALGSRKKGRAKEIVELKQLAIPAVSVGNWGSLGASRITKVTDAVWPKEERPSLYDTIELDGSLFLLRSRAKEGLKLTDLTAKQSFQVLATQVGILANLHAKSFEKNLSEDQLQKGRSWLQSASLELSQSYIRWFKRFSGSTGN